MTEEPIEVPVEIEIPEDIEREVRERAGGSPYGIEEFLPEYFDITPKWEFEGQ